MNFPLRALVAVACVLSLTAGVLTAMPDFAADNGLDFWNLSEHRTRLDAALRRQEQLEREGTVIVNRTAARAEVVEGVIAGRIGPEEAARTFEQLNRTDAETLERIRRCYPDGTDEVRAARQLVSHVRCFPHPGAKRVASEI